MAVNDDFEDDDNESNEPTPKDLRAQIKKLSKELAEAKETNVTLGKQVRTRSVADILSEKGLSPKVAGLMPDTVEADAASIDAWLAEYGDVFGVTKTEPNPADAGDEVDAETKAAHERVANATAGGEASGKAATLEAKIAAAKTPAELSEILANA